MERSDTASNIFKKRCVCAVLSTSLLQTIVLFVLLCFAHFDPFQPFQWLTSTTEKFLSPRIWCNLIIVGILISIQSVLYSQNFVAVSQIATSRFALLRKFLSCNYLLLLNFHLLIWGFITWMLMQHFDIYFEEATSKCSSEKRIMIFASGICFGVFFFIFDSRNVEKSFPQYLQFPVIHQLRFLQVKMSLFPIFKQSVVDAVPLTLVFFILYFWRGNMFREVVCEYHVLIGSSPCEDTFYCVWSVGTICLVWFFYSIAFNIVYTMKLFFRVYLTEHHTFPVVAPFGKDPTLSLHGALSSTNAVVLQLGYLDLRVLAEKDRRRQEELFSLSHLGGHPHNWNAVVETTLKMIKDFSDTLNAAMSDESSASVSPAANKTKAEGAGDELAMSSARKPPLRNLSLGRGAPVQQTVAAGAEERLLDVVVRQGRAVVGRFLRQPGVGYLLGERVELKVRYALSSAQVVAWAVEGLSLLAAASVTLDRYGVALKDLPSLVEILLDLRRALDKLHKMSSVRRELRGRQVDLKVRAGLQAAVKRSLYRITTAFQEHVDQLPVAAHVRAQLRAFALFREG